MVINLYQLTLIALFILISSLYSSVDIVFFPVIILLFILFCISSIRVKINILVIFYIYFIVLLLVSLFWALNLNNSLIHTFFVCLIFISILYFYFIIFNDNNKIKQFMFVIIIGSLIVNFRNLYLYVSDISSLRFGGVAEHPNALALMSSTFAVISVLYLFLYNVFYKKKIIILFSLFLSMFFLFVSGSRGGIISFIIFSAMIYFSFTRVLNLKFIFIFILISLLILYNFSYILEQPFFQRILLLPQALGIDYFNYIPENSEYRFAADDSRVVLADIAINKFLENPLTGYGVNSFGYFSEYNYTHNNFLEILFSLGIFGVILFYLPLLIIFLHTFTLRNDLINKYIKALRALIMYYVISGMSIPNFQSKVQLFIVVLILCFYSFIIKNKSIDLKLYKS